MKYKSAKGILPQDLIEMIQEYVQGEYVYIPIKERQEKVIPTEYEVEVRKRDEHIYTGHLEGVSNKKLSDMYNLSESSIRRIIGNQRKRYESMKDRVQVIVKEWSMNVADIKQIYDSTWQIGDEYKGIPVGRIVPTDDETLFASDEQYYYVLSHRLHGSNIVSLENNIPLAKEMGRIIADLHIAFKECESQDEFWNNSLLDEMKGWVRSALSDNEWKYISGEKFDYIVARLEELYDKLPVQLIHRDVHFGNFLFDNGKFSGYVDFDLSQRNIRVFDLCYFVLGLLSEEEKLDVSVGEWIDIVKNVFDGYQEKISLSEEEKQAVPYVMMAIELLFVAWFINQEDAKCAEDAVRIFKLVKENNKLIRI